MKWEIVVERKFKAYDVVRFRKSSGTAEIGMRGVVVATTVKEDGDDRFVVFIPKRLSPLGNIILVAQANKEDLELTDQSLEWYELLEVQ